MKSRRTTLLALASLIALLILTAALSACSQEATPDETPNVVGQHSGDTPTPSGHLDPADCPPASAAKSLTGAGATFPALLYESWFVRWQQLCGIEVNYQAIGSGAGIQQISGKTVDFGASDAIMTDEEKAAAEGPIHAIPMTSDAVAMIYNVQGLESQALILDGPTIADMFLGKITRWNDPKIAQLNPGVTLPDVSLTVVHRSDGSGTTAIFTNYLSQVSPEWESQVGTATSVYWPVGNGGNGNAGVAGQVQEIPNTIGYVSLAYAKLGKFAYANLINKSGKTITPTIESARAASVGITLPDNMEVLITDSPNADAYPITGFTWLLVYAEQDDKEKATSLGSLIKWMLSPTGGQQFCESLDYVPLSDEAQQKALAELADTKYQGTPITQLQ